MELLENGEKYVDETPKSRILGSNLANWCVICRGQARGVGLPEKYKKGANKYTCRHLGRCDSQTNHDEFWLPWCLWRC
jgi:hypothetical protein